MEEKEIHLRDYLRVIQKRKSTVLTFFIVTLLVVVIATFTATPIYRATTKVMMERNSSGSLTSSYTYLSYDPEFLETQYQVITSMAVAEKVSELMGPDKVYDVFFPESESSAGFLSAITGWFGSLKASLKEMMGIGKLSSSYDDDADPLGIGEELSMTKGERVARMVQSGISVSPVSNSRVVEISYYSENPALAMKVVNSVAQAYISELMDMRMAVSDYSITWMTKKAEAQKEKLEQSEIAYQEYLRKQDIVTVEDKVTVLPERLSELTRQLTNAETENKELKAVYDQILGIDAASLETIPTISENASVVAIKKQIRDAEQNISELSKKYGPKHPTMISAQDELEGLNAKKRTEIDKIVQTIRNRYQLAVSNEDDLRNLLEETKFEASNLNEKYVQLSILKREVETNRNLYDALIKKLKESDITQERQSVNVWVIEEADLPGAPAKPNKKRNILLAIVLGLFGGIGLAFFIEYLDNTVKSPEDVEEKFDIPVIGTVPLFKSETETIVQNILGETASPVSESFNSLRTSLFLSSADTLPGSIVVTSTSPGEGKSSISACLAMTVARAGKKTLLIDADMRRPVQHTNFQLENKVGLSSILAGQATADFIHNGTVKNLSIITAGPIPPNPSELLSSEKLKQLTRKLSGLYDMVIIDAPPVLNVSDALLISKHVRGTVMVSWAGSTTYDLLRKCLKRINEAATPLIGMVMNRLDAKKSGYYYGYSDYYYSSSEEKNQ